MKRAGLSRLVHTPAPHSPHAVCECIPGALEALPIRRRRRSVAADEAATLGGASATLAISRSRLTFLSIAPIIEPTADASLSSPPASRFRHTVYTRMNIPDDVIEPFRNDRNYFNLAIRCHYLPPRSVG